jgi:hypothetical protein
MNIQEKIRGIFCADKSYNEIREQIIGLLEKYSKENKLGAIMPFFGYRVRQKASKILSNKDRFSS